MPGPGDPCLLIWSKTPSPTSLPDSQSHDFGEGANIKERWFWEASENVDPLSRDHGVFRDILC